MKKNINQYVLDILVSIDQLANAIGGGNPDCTISARTHVLHGRYWRLVERVIDYAFFPVDGEGHCRQAFENEPDEIYYGNHFANYFVSVIAVILCLSFIRPLLWVISKIEA
jgi:hypothetical protein